MLFCYIVFTLYVYTKSGDDVTTAHHPPETQSTGDTAGVNQSGDSNSGVNAQHTFQPIASQHTAATAVHDVTFVSAHPVVTYPPSTKRPLAPADDENVKSLEEEFFDVQEEFDDALTHQVRVTSLD